MDSQFIDIAKTAERLGMGQKAVRNGIRRGTIPTARIGKSYLIPVSFFKSLEAKATAK